MVVPSVGPRVPSPSARADCRILPNTVYPAQTLGSLLMRRQRLGTARVREQRPLELPDHEWACPQGSSLTGCLKDLCFLPKLCVGEDFSGKHPDFNAMYVETTDLLKYPFSKD